MNTKTECYALELTQKTFNALTIITQVVVCLIKFEDEWTYITAKEKDFALIEDILAEFV